MKKLVVVIAFIISFSTVNAQDKIVKINGEIIICNVTEITDDNIKFKYDGEDLLNNISQNIVQEIEFKSGRIQKFSTQIEINGEEDWEKVQLTTLESDIDGLVKGEEMMAKASSGWSTTGQGKMQKKAMEKLKKQAAVNGYHIVLLMTTTGKGGHYGFSGGTKSSVTGVGYSYPRQQSMSDKPQSTSNKSIFQVGDKVIYSFKTRYISEVILVNSQLYDIKWQLNNGEYKIEKNVKEKYLKKAE